METLSFREAIHSRSNRFFFRLRTALKFRRCGYREAGTGDLMLNGAALRLERQYGMARFRPHLQEIIYRKNLSTLAWLENLGPFIGELPAEPEVLEAGTQDFSRLPAIRRFLEENARVPRVTGLELDPYPILVDLHSRADRAEYYLKVGGASGDCYEGGDFFEWQAQADCVLSFYPFVSTNPALAWGLPAEFGNGRKWAESFARVLRPGGLLLVVHQGDWEEEEFDKVRTGLPLQLLARDKANAEIYPLPHPACMSIYRREK